MNWQRGKHIAKHSLKWLNWTVILPTLLLCLLLVVLLYTQAGLRVNLWLAESFVPELSVERSEGSLLGGNTLYNLRWQQGDNTLELQSLALDIDNRCLLKLSLCIDVLALHGLTLSLQSTESAQNVPSATVGAFWLPIPVKISRLTLNDGAVAINAHQLQWQGFSTAVEAWGNKIRLSQPLWRDVNLTLANTTETEATTIPFVYQPPELSDFTLPLKLYIDQFRLNDFSLTQQGNVYRLQQLLFELQWQDTQLNLTHLELTHPQGTLQGSVHIGTTALLPLTAEALVQLTEGELSGQQLSINSKGNLEALVIEASARGAIVADLALNINLLNPLLPHQLQLSSTALQWPVTPRYAAATADVLLTDSQLNLNGTIEQSEISASTVVRSRHVPDSAIDFNGKVSQQGLSLHQLLINTLGGQINSELSLNWQQGLKWHSEVRLSNIAPGLFWPDYPGVLNGQFSHNGELDGGKWQLALENLDISGRLRDYALQLSGSLNAADQSGDGDYQFSSTGLQLRHADNALKISGNLKDSWQLMLQLDVPELAQSVAQARGTLVGEFNISGERQKPEMRGSLTASRLRFQQLSLQQLTLNSSVWLDAAKNWHTELELEASGGKYQQQHLQHLRAQLRGSEQNHQLTLSLDAAEHQASFALQGSLKNTEWQAQLEQAVVNSPLGQWQLTETTALTYLTTSQRFTMAAHCWGQQSSNLCATVPLIASPAQISTELTLTQMPLSTLTALLPGNTMLSGAIDAYVSFSWLQGKAPLATLKLNSKAGALTQQLTTPLTLAWQSFELQSQLNADTVQNDLQFTFSEQSSLSANVSISALQSDDKQLAGEIILQQFVLDFLQPLLGEFSELSGIVSGDLRLAGTLQQPLLHGVAELQRSRIKGKLAPVDIDNADITLTFSGQNASLIGLVTTPKGEINLSGTADWQQLSDWKAELNIKGDELRLQIPQARLQIAPDLTLTATPQLTRISGTVQVPNADINIDNLPQNAVELSDDLVLLDEQLNRQPVEQTTMFVLQTDIKVQLGERVRLSAFGLKTRLKGNLRVRQQPQKPLRVNGDVNLIDGTFRAYGQDLLIRKGKMNFNGPADQPFLDIEAIRNPDNMEDAVIAGIRVNGPADNPSVEVFSEPAKAQANALAYLLMGRDLDSESGNAGNAVTTSLIGITLSSSSKVVGEIGEAFGLRDLTLDTAGAGDNSQVTVSGYLSRDLQLKYGYGIFNAVGEFTLRYRLMRQLYLEAISGLDNAVDLLYKFEFD